MRHQKSSLKVKTIQFTQEVRFAEQHELVAVTSCFLQQFSRIAVCREHDHPALGPQIADGKGKGHPAHIRHGCIGNRQIGASRPYMFERTLTVVRYRCSEPILFENSGEPIRHHGFMVYN